MSTAPYKLLAILQDKSLLPLAKAFVFLLAPLLYLCSSNSVEAETLQPNESKTVYLSGYTAELSGPPLQRRNGTLRYWHNVDSSASWKVHAPSACEVEVKVVVAADKHFAGSSFDVHLGGKSLSGTMPGTGGWETLFLGN